MRALRYEGFADTIRFYDWFMFGVKVDCYWLIDNGSMRDGLHDSIKAVMRE